MPQHLKINRRGMSFVQIFVSHTYTDIYLFSIFQFARQIKSVILGLFTEPLHVNTTWTKLFDSPILR